MEAAQPRAEAIAIRNDRILAVGTDDAVGAFQGPATRVVSLGGLTVTPGFIDAHQHRIGDGPSRLSRTPGQLVNAAIEQGYTTIDELYVDQARLDELRDLDQSGALRLRVNAYLPVQENSAEGTLLGDYFDAYEPGQSVSPHVRVAGIKVFTDFDNAQILLWRQADLNAFLLEQHSKGWQLAVKTVSSRSLAMIIEALQAIQAADADIVTARARLEHMLFATADQIGALKALGLVPVINLNIPGQLVGDPDIAELIAREPAGSYTPWRSLFDLDLPAAGMSGFPSAYVDEPSGAPFGSPIHLIYQAVTRVGNLGVTSPPELLDQAIGAEQAMAALTVNAARAGFEEADKGSLAPGKLADLTVLSADPLAVPADQINEIDVVMTMIGGSVEYCAAGSEALCPGVGSGSSEQPEPSAASSGATGGLVVTASSSLPGEPPQRAVDGSRDTIWNAGAGPEQWIQIDLGSPRTLEEIRLVTAQYPPGRTVHQVWGGSSQATLRLLHEFDGDTEDNQELRYAPATPEANVRFIRIVTTQSPSWVAWREIEITPP